MSSDIDPEAERLRLEQQLEQAKRLASAVADPTTIQRIGAFISDLRQSLERWRARRRSKDDIRARARQLWEQAGRPQGRDEEFWFQAERELNEDGIKSPD
jgi:hypothetical protein